MLSAWKRHFVRLLECLKRFINVYTELSKLKKEVIVFSLRYSCFTVLYWFLLYNQLEYTYIPSCPCLPSPVSHPSRSSTRAPEPSSLRYTAGSRYLFHTWGCIDVRPHLPVHPTPFPSVSTRLCSCLCLYSCLADRFICTISHICALIYDTRFSKRGSY